MEFALILPVLALLLFGMLDFGKAFNYWIDETHLANEGARFATVNKNPSGSGSLQQYIRDQVTSNELTTAAPPPSRARFRSASTSRTARRTSGTRYASR